MTLFNGRSSYLLNSLVSTIGGSGHYLYENEPQPKVKAAPAVPTREQAQRMTSDELAAILSKGDLE